MESIVANAFAIILLWLVYYAIFKYSKPLPLPSLKTLPIWAIVSILLETFAFIATVYWLLNSNYSFHPLSFFDYTVSRLSIVSYIMPLLWLSSIGIVFIVAKKSWVRKNPKYGRLILPEKFKSQHIESVSIQSVDGIVNGRGTCFSSTKGYLIAKGKHKIELECFEHNIFKKSFAHNTLYSKTITIDVVPGVCYTIEALLDKKSFSVSRSLESSK